MRLFLQIYILIVLGCSSFTILALEVGQHLPNTTAAYTEKCSNTTKAYISDWSRWLYIKLSDKAVAFPPVWSKGGQHIAYSVNEDGNYEIYARDLSTGLTLNLTTSRKVDMAPSWSPDNRFIAYISDGSVTVKNMLSGETYAFPVHVATNIPPRAWSSDGRYIAISGFYLSNHEDIFLLDVVNYGVRNISNSQFDLVKYPAWAPDGKNLTFTALKDGISQIYIANLEKNMVSRFTKYDEYMYNEASWSAHTQLIAAITEENQIHILNSTGDLQQKIYLDAISKIKGGRENGVTWSPDGNYLAIHVYVNSQWSNYTLHLASGEINSVSPNYCYYSDVSWRPNI